MGLKVLHISSFAIIEQLTVEFDAGFSVITGETGAGKSIIIDALNLALGEKASVTMIRAGAESASIECTFDDIGNPLERLLRDNQFPGKNGDLTLKRELNINGRSKAWINDVPCTIGQLKSIGDLLVDLHGQHDHQSLLQEENHIQFLDAFGDYQESIKKVHDTYLALSHVIEKHKLLSERRKLNKEKRELWEFQLQEIDKVAPEEGEYEELSKEKAILDNSEKINSIAEELTQQLFDGDENTLYQQILDVNKKLGVLNRIDPEFSEELNRIEETRFLIQDLSKHLTSYIQNIQFDPGRAEIVNQRLYQLQQLIKKYGSSVQEILKFREILEKKLDEDDGLDNELMKLESEIERTKIRYSEEASRLSKNRKSTARIFEERIVQALSNLGILNSMFEVSINYIDTRDGWVEIDGRRIKCDPTGIDNIVFLISTNPGEPLRPLANIVSGGEVSRIMLAMKSIMAGKDRIPVVIFDEIDTGISGKIAQVVGRQLKALSNVHQVICITHLPQIAGLGDHHYKVYKLANDERSQTSIMRLNQEGRIVEIASLIGGATVTDTTLQQARELLSPL